MDDNNSMGTLKPIRKKIVMRKDMPTLIGGNNLQAYVLYNIIKTWLFLNYL